MRSTAVKAESFKGMTRLLVSFLLVRMWTTRLFESKSFRLTCFTSTPRIEVLAGVNLPMLVKLARVRGDLEIKQAVTMAAEAGRKYINVASESLGG